MATSNKIHLWPFHLWDGVPPNLPRQHISTHMRPGVNATSHTKVGKWGEPFTVVITSYYSSYAKALDAIVLAVNPLLDQPLLRLWYGSIDYLVRYQTMYQPVDIQIAECFTAIRVVGNGLNLPNAGVLRVQLTLVPHAV